MGLEWIDEDNAVITCQSALIYLVINICYIDMANQHRGRTKRHLSRRRLELSPGGVTVELPKASEFAGSIITRSKLFLLTPFRW